MKTYIFESERLGFRNWTKEDLEPMSELNGDEEVMEFFPSTFSRAHTEKFIERMQEKFDAEGFCFYAVEKLENNEFIGFIGFVVTSFEADFTPCEEIGWRLKRAAWGKGYATEGAIRCLDYGFNELGFKSVKSFTTVSNFKSEKVMKKIGMKKIGEFDHPYVTEESGLKRHVLYSIDKTS